MRVALISDLHANAIALDAVLEDIGRVGVDRVICLGDVATLGPAPLEVIDTLQQLGCDCILGNHDAFLLEPELIHSYTEAPEVVQAVDWCRKQLSEAALGFLGTFLPTLSVELDAHNTLLAYHGSPRSHTEDLLSTTPPEALDLALAGHRAQVMAGGHTHLQMLRQHRGTLVVNPGSVGLPFEAFTGGGPPRVLPHSEYALVESIDGSIAVTLRHLPLDRSRLHGAALAVDHPLAGMLAAQYS